jgi:hypothetical protein
MAITETTRCWLHITDVLQLLRTGEVKVDSGDGVIVTLALHFPDRTTAAHILERWETRNGYTDD